MVHGGQGGGGDNSGYVAQIPRQDTNTTQNKHNNAGNSKNIEYEHKTWQKDEHFLITKSIT